MTKSIKMNIEETFLALTSRTYPYGYEDELFYFLPEGYQTDEDGNYFYEIGNSKTIFASHLDTACKEQVGVIHVFDGDIIRTNGKSILGADDKAGVTILLYLIEKKIPGLYYFFIGEEVGCIGSGLASKNTEKFKNYDRIISFDRRGTTSVITHQSGKRSCSDEFANALARELNVKGLKYSKDSTGVYTDSAEFVNVIPECTNISVGYYKEHTHEEHQDISHLIKLCEVSALVDWESLPTKRDKSKVEWDDEYVYSWGAVKKYSKNTNTPYDDDDNKIRSGYNKNWKNWNKKSKNVYYEDIDKPLFKKGKKYELVDTKTFTEEDFPSIKNQVRDRGAYYDSLKRIVFNDKLTRDEFSMIKDQYLDMDDIEDRKFASYIESVL